MEQIIRAISNKYWQLLSNSSSFTLGLSGGVDSMVLLHIFAQLRNKLPIFVSAVHINHGISQYSNDWELFCIQVCDRLNIPIKVSRNIVNKFGGESLENNARDVRYREFKQFKDSVIVLAHHKNDQVETMLSQLLRGSDIHNLGAMRYISENKSQIFWRPLLNTTRLEIESLAKTHHIDYVEDESNKDTKYLRNFIRQKLLPEMLAWDKTILTKVNNVIMQIQDTNQLLDEVAVDDFTFVKCDGEQDGILLERFRQLSKLRQINVLCYFIHRYKIKLPSKKKIVEFCRQINTAGLDSTRL